jgi:ApbE family protein
VPRLILRLACVLRPGNAPSAARGSDIVSGARRCALRRFGATLPFILAACHHHAAAETTSEPSEVSKINANPERWIGVGPETFAVISRALEEGKASSGAFDITFQAMSDIWKFGSAAEAQPKIPSKADIEQRRKLVDYRKVELDARARTVRIGSGQKLGLGGGLRRGTSSTAPRVS